MWGRGVVRQGERVAIVPRETTMAERWLVPLLDRGESTGSLTGRRPRQDHALKMRRVKTTPLRCLA